ncbi:MAG: hypothetical protein ACJ790_09740 [Myxococcaceae bacterium]
MKRLLIIASAACALAGCLDFTGAADDRCASDRAISGCGASGGGGGGAVDGGDGGASSDSGTFDSGSPDSGVWDGGWWELPVIPFSCPAASGLPDGGSSADMSWDNSREQDAGANVNTGYFELTPTVSADGLTLCFSRGALGSGDLYCATRPTVNDTYGPPVEQTAINTADDELWPELSPDATVLYFTRAPSTSITDHTLYAAHRSSTGLNFIDPIPVFGVPSGFVRGPRFTCDGTKLYFVSANSGSYAAWSANVPRKGWLTEAHHEAQLDPTTPDWMTEISVTPDGRTAVVTSHNAQYTNNGAWFATKFTNTGPGSAWTMTGNFGGPFFYGCHGIDFDQSYAMTTTLEQSGGFYIFTLFPQ